MPQFEDLSQEMQLKYLQKAKYLIEYSYVENDDVEALAKKIYISDKESGKLLL